MKIGIDVDGVLANFNESYIELIKKETGIALPKPDATYPDQWHYERAGGVTREQENRIWEEIKSTQFWGTLQPMAGALDALRRLNALRFTGVQSYFITSRPGRMAKFYTEMWLKFHGMDMPTVVIADDKGSVAKGIVLDVFVDDKPENIQDVAATTARTRVYLIDQPYNREYQQALKEYPDLRDARAIVVGSLSEVLDREIPQSKLKRAA